MSTATVVKEGKIQFLKDIQAAVAQNLVLFKNNITVDADTVWSDLTEADFTGYIRATSLTWGTPALNGSDQAESSASAVTFAVSSLPSTSNTIYGWALVYAFGMSTVIRAANNLSSPKSMAVFGDSITVTLTEILDQL